MLRDMQMALVRKHRRRICLHQYRQRVLRRLDGLRRFLRRLGGERMSKEYIDREAAEKVAAKYGCTNGATVGIHSGIADCIAFDDNIGDIMDTLAVHDDLKAKLSRIKK